METIGLKERQKGFAYVTGRFASKNEATDSEIMSALKLNPKGIVERAMESRPEDLQKLVNEIEDAQNAFDIGYGEGMPKRDLNSEEIKNYNRLSRLILQGTPKDSDNAKTEMEAFVVSRIMAGANPQDFLNLRRLAEGE